MSRSRTTWSGCDNHRAAATGVIPAAVLGALSPDVDMFLLPRGWDRYMTAHESGTHSVVGALVCAALAAALARAVWRRGRYGAMLAAAVIGAAQPSLVRSVFRRDDSPVLALRRCAASATSVPLRWRTRGWRCGASRPPSMIAAATRQACANCRDLLGGPGDLRCREDGDAGRGGTPLSRARTRRW